MINPVLNLSMFKICQHAYMLPSCFKAIVSKHIN